MGDVCVEFAKTPGGRTEEDLPEVYLVPMPEVGLDRTPRVRREELDEADYSGTVMS